MSYKRSIAPFSVNVVVCRCAKGSVLGPTCQSVLNELGMCRVLSLFVIKRWLLMRPCIQLMCGFVRRRAIINVTLSQQPLLFPQQTPIALFPHNDKLIMKQI